MLTQREWTTIREYEDILFDYYNGIARITINRERYRNAFTPTTTAEMSDALRICREEADIDVIVITGAGDKAFCSGGDQNVKGRGGYIGKDGVPRLSVLDVQYPETCNCRCKRFCYRWRACASCGVRLVYRFRECCFRSDRSSCRQF